VHGCFWHGHDCVLFKLPRSNAEFWEAKIDRNRAVDQRAVAALGVLRWRVLTLWECALRGPGRRPVYQVIDEVSEWLRSGAPSRELRGE